MGVGPPLNVGTAVMEGAIAWGPYAMTAGTRFSFFEIASPRALRVLSVDTTAGKRPLVKGGILYTGIGGAWDLQAGTSPLRLWDPSFFAIGNFCSMQWAMLDDQELSVSSNSLTVSNNDLLTDRNTSTVWATGSDSYSVSHPTAGVVMTGVATWGYYAVVAERRADGIYVEVFDVRKAADRNTAFVTTKPDLTADSKGLLKLTPTGYVPAATAVAEVAMRDGRAIITIDDGSMAPPSPGIYFVDVRGLMDDNAATGLSAADIQGTLPVSGCRQADALDGYVFIATRVGLVTAQVPEAFDNSSSTIVPGSQIMGVTTAGTAPLTVTALPGGTQGLAVFGSYLLTSPDQAGSGSNPSGVFSFDVADPLDPLQIGGLAFQNFPGSSFCGANTMFRTGVTMAGQRGYMVSSSGDLVVFDLE